MILHRVSPQLFSPLPHARDCLPLRGDTFYRSCQGSIRTGIVSDANDDEWKDTVRNKRHGPTRARKRDAEQEARADRRHLYKSNKPRLMLALSRLPMMLRWRKDLACVVIDARDRDGRELAELAGSLDESVEAIRQRGKIPTALLILPAGAVANFFADSRPDLARQIARASPLGMLRVIVLGGGGVTLLYARRNSFVR